MTEDVTSGVMRMLAPILETEGLSLYDIEYIKRSRSSILRIYIDREGGVNHGHCQAVSNRLSAQLDVEDIIAGPYTLEVSSPGLTRRLKKEEHFIKSDGCLAKVTFKKEFGSPQQVLGTLQVIEKHRFRIVPKSGKEPVEFGFDDVAKAALEIE
ncbi:MAG: ribosome maturation factor RimP [Nitrospinota bacterium]